MSANIITFTEDFTNAVWTASDGLTVTPNAFPPPTYLGINAAYASTLTDPSNTLQSILIGDYKLIPNDASSWTASLFVKKDSDTTRFPNFFLQFANGTGFFPGISVNTQTGAIATLSGGTPPDASGVVNVDSNYWRFWFTIANNNTGNNAVRVLFNPANAAIIGGPADGTLTGSVTVTGFNLTNDPTLQEYQPDPYYPFVLSNNLPFFAQIGAKRLIY